MANTKITTNVIADDAITSAKIADDAVGNDQLASGLTLGGNTTATLATAAQPNITSVGTLTGFTSTGIDDNADATAITIGSDEGVTFAAGITSTQPNAFGACSFNEADLTNVGTVFADQYLGDADTDTGIVMQGSNVMSLHTGNSERMRIASDGDVLVGGTSDRGRKFVVEGTGDLMALYSTNAGAGGAQLDLIHDSSSPADGDNVGIINFSDDAKQYASIKGIAQNTNVSGAMHLGVRTDASNYNATALVIDSSGKVGINETSPSKLLHVTSNTDYEGIQIKGSGHKQLKIESISSGRQVLATFQSDSQNMSIGLDTDNDFIFHSGTAGAERMCIRSSGNVLIGATSDVNSGSIFQVSGSASGGNGAITFMNSADNGPALSCFKTPTTTSSTARFIQFYADSGNTPMGGISGNGASNAQFVTLSDERDKENIIPVNNVLDKLMNLNVVSFDWKKNDEHVKAGFIAQNVEKYFPEYIVENVSNEDAEARKGTTGGMSAGYIAVLTKAIQEQQTVIEDLKSRIETLEG